MLLYPNTFSKELSTIIIESVVSFLKKMLLFKEKLQKRQRLFIFFVLPGEGLVLVGVEGRAVVGAWVGVCTTERKSHISIKSQINYFVIEYTLYCKWM